MLNLLDELLRKILMDGVDQLKPVVAGGPTAVTDQQIGFVPPDNDWRTAVGNLQRNALNVYLVDLRENRKLRSNERDRAFTNGIAYDTPAPMRLDCHYLISAWSPIDQLTPAVEPTFDEHMLLYQAAAVLANAAPFNPSRVYPAGSAPLTAWPARFQDSDLPAVVAPTEGFPKLAEFWGTMGQDFRWKPVLHLVVTIPVELITEVAGPLVTTRITEYRQWGKPETAEVWIQIGGTVFDNVGNTVADAWVQIQTMTNQPLNTTTSDSNGRYTFDRLQPGNYQLVWSASGHPTPPLPRAITVPSPTGEYDLRFV